MDWTSRVSLYESRAEVNELEDVDQTMSVKALLSPFGRFDLPFLPLGGCGIIVENKRKVCRGNQGVRHERGKPRPVPFRRKQQKIGLLTIFHGIPDNLGYLGFRPVERRMVRSCDWNPSI